MRKPVQVNVSERHEELRLGKNGSELSRGGQACFAGLPVAPMNDSLISAASERIKNT